MSFQLPVGSNSYTKVHRVWVDSKTSKKDPAASDFNYTAVLPVELQKIVGISVSSWHLPWDSAPSFFPSTTFVTGNKSLDFSLENPDVASAAQAFVATWPTKYYVYASPGNPEADYLDALTKLMNNAISADAVWAGKVSIQTYTHPLGNTLLTVGTTDSTLPDGSTTKLRLLFATGANSATACNIPMGFAKADVASSSTGIYTGTGAQTIESPYQTFLRPFPYVDVFVAQSNRKPLKRIYIEDSFYTNATMSTESVHQLIIDTDNPPRVLGQLDISLRYPNGVDPGFYISDAPHSIGFTIVQLADELAPVPAFIKQNLAW